MHFLPLRYNRGLLELPRVSRLALWKKTFDAVEALAEDLEKLPVSPSTDPKLSRDLLSQVDFERPMDPEAALALAVEGLRHQQVHNGHPRYFGLFNPATTTMSIAADTLVAAFNPQLAAWTHAPFACEVDQMLIREIGARFGYARETCSGSFTSGGAEANHTALLMALIRRFPRFGEDGAPLTRRAPRGLRLAREPSLLRQGRLGSPGSARARCAMSRSTSNT